MPSLTLPSSTIAFGNSPPFHLLGSPLISYSHYRDSFRTVHPLYTITQRAAQAEMVRSLIDIWRHDGFLPDCRMSLDKGFTQGVRWDSRRPILALTDLYTTGIQCRQPIV
jgi:putative alpha-1,2-mannosidase